MFLTRRFENKELHMSEPRKRPSVRMGEAEMWDFIRDAHTGILTTLKSDGSPVSLPVWFALIDGKIYMSTRGKKLLRIKNNPVSSFLVEDGQRWAELRAVHLSGRCEVVQAEGEVQDRFAAETKRKYAAFRTAPDDMPEISKKAYSSGMELVCFIPEGKILNWNNKHLGVS